jgi:site-specific recombinase XerD
MAALRDPMTVGIATRVLAIPVKRADKRLVLYLTRAEIDAMLAAHDLTGWAGRRDHALLLTLHNTGARVSEITGLQRTDPTRNLAKTVADNAVKLVRTSRGAEFIMARSYSFTNRPDILSQAFLFSSCHFSLAIGRRTIHCFGEGVQTARVRSKS